MTPPISIRDSVVTETGIYAANLIIREILDFRYEIKKTSTEHQGEGIMFTADLGSDTAIHVFLIKRKEHRKRNSELDDRWYPAFAWVEEGFEESFFILHFSPKDIHAYYAPPKIIGYSEVAVVDRDKVLSYKRMHNVEPNRHVKPKVLL